MCLYRALLFCVLGVWAVGSASASPITYNVTVNTSSIAGSVGSLDFNFNPGPLAVQDASVQILNVSSDGIFVGSAAVIGNVSGTLPTTLTFDNGTAFNDYFQEFTFGSTLAFDVSFLGPALSSPDGVSTSGSTFAFSLFSDIAGTLPTLTTNLADGFAFTVDVNLDGTTTATNFSSQVTGLPSVSNPLPEPASIALLAMGFTIMMRSHRRQFLKSKRLT